MSDYDAMLAAVAARPDDDTPRLVMADWLSDHGGEDGERQAAFIRVHVAYARERRVTYQRKMERQIKRRLGACVALRMYPADVVLDHLRAGMRVEGWGYTVAPVVPCATVRRGFVDEWFGRVSDLFGGPCGSCIDENGHQWRRFHPDGRPDPCLVCGGEGRVPGVAARLGRLPLTQITLAGVTPHGIDRVGVSIWNAAAPRHPMSAVAESARVPAELYAVLERRAGSYTVGRCCYFRDTAHALAELSEAAIILCQERAAEAAKAEPAPAA